MLFHLPCSIGSLWFVVRNLHRVKKFVSSKISKYCSKINISLKIQYIRVLEQLCNVSHHVCWNWSCNLIVILHFNQTSLMNMCVSQIYEKQHSFKIVFTLFNQDKFAFCVLHKWYIKRHTTEQILDCFPVIRLVQYDTIRCFISM
jgi:hypothetical protein